MTAARTVADLVADAVLGIDTLWGGDVMAASGAQRCVADSWFSREPLPLAYAHESAAGMILLSMSLHPNRVE